MNQIEFYRGVMDDRCTGLDWLARYEAKDGVLPDKMDPSVRVEGKVSGEQRLAVYGNLREEIGISGRLAVRFNPGSVADQLLRICEERDYIRAERDAKSPRTVTYFDHDGIHKAERSGEKVRKKLRKWKKSPFGW